ncbi:TonB-dependent receptor [Tsuneonella dongtanensis]|uniref:TonB-dependent receptor n=1 Tax=Tsuneonella dongtanensis TaxID=692370 RepID=UPI0018DCFDB6|nr:TonB-dependent receptor [Tsuneonella dongtanensis]
MTARLREEDVQDVPISITQLDNETLERAELNDLQDVAALVPGLVSSSPFGRINASPSIRGIVNAGLGEEQPVAFFLDGVYISGRTALNGTLFGLERIEVARGPQSALYGRNAFAGAVNYITKRPGNRLEGKAQLTAGTQDLYEGKLEVSGPISSALSLGGGLLYRTDDGFFRNSVSGGPEVGSNKTVAALAAANWEPSDALTVYVKALYTDEKDGAPPHFLVPANSQPDQRTGFPRYYTGELPQSGAGFFTNPEHQGVEREALRLSANVDLRLGDKILLQSLTGYNASDGFYDFDADYTARFFNRTLEEFDRYDISQDLRLSGENGDATFNWLVGGSYYYLTDDLLARNYLPGFGQTLPVGTLTTRTTRTWSAYGALELKPSSQVSLRGELRWQNEAATFDSQLVNQAGVPLDLEADWDAWLPRFTASYFPGAGNTMIYASIARGFKAGGYNSFASLFDTERTYEPETNWTYEVGAKTELAPRVTINGALFWMDWSNQQVIGLSTRAPSNNQFTTNAAQSRSRGLELELAYASHNGFSGNIGYALIDAEFLEFQDQDLAFVPIGTDVSGNRIPRTSKHTLNATLQYEGAIGASSSWYARIDGSYQSNQFSTPANLARTGSLTNVNARVGVEFGRVEVAGWVRNLFDDRNPYVGVRWFDATGTYTGLPPFQRAWLVTAREGRRGGISLTYRFGS